MSTAATRPPKVPRRRGSCTRPGALIERSTGSAVAASCGPRRTKRRLGRAAPHDHRAEVRARAQRHHRLRRGRPGPRRDCDERLGRRPSLVVAQPRSASRRHRSTGQPASAPGARARPQGRSVIGCGSAGSRSIHSSTPTPGGARPRLPWSSSNRATGPLDTAGRLTIGASLIWARNHRNGIPHRDGNSRCLRHCGRSLGPELTNESCGQDVRGL